MTPVVLSVIGSVKEAVNNRHGDFEEFKRKKRWIKTIIGSFVKLGLFVFGRSEII